MTVEPPAVRITSLSLLLQLLELLHSSHIKQATSEIRNAKQLPQHSAAFRVRPGYAQCSQSGLRSLFGLRHTPQQITDYRIGRSWVGSNLKAAQLRPARRNVQQQCRLTFDSELSRARCFLFALT
jgi:hypothetical protein